MERTMENYLKSMTREERYVAMNKLLLILWQIQQDNYAYWGYPGSRYPATITVQLGTDVIEYQRGATDEQGRSKSVSFNGKRTNRTRLNGIIEKLFELNGIVDAN